MVTKKIIDALKVIIYVHQTAQLKGASLCALLKTTMISKKIKIPIKPHKFFITAEINTLVKQNVISVRKHVK
jgi:translation elongation factor EF-4